MRCGGGALGEVIDLATSRMADDLELPPPGIVASSLGRDVVALGALSAAREAALGIVLPLLTERRPLPAFD